MEDKKLIELANEIEYFKNLQRYVTFFKEQKEYGRVEVCRHGASLAEQDFISIYKVDNSDIYENFCIICANYFKEEAAKVKFKIERKLKEGDSHD